MGKYSKSRFFKVDFTTQEEELDRIGGEPRHVIITGGTGVGKSFMAANLVRKYGGNAIYHSVVGGTDEENIKYILRDEPLKEAIEVTFNEVMERKSSGRKDFTDKFLVIDEIYRVKEIVYGNKKLEEIIKSGGDVDVYVILTTQLKINLVEEDYGEIIDMFEKVYLPKPKRLE